MASLELKASTKPTIDDDQMRILTPTPPPDNHPVGQGGGPRTIFLFFRKWPFKMTDYGTFSVTDRAIFNRWPPELFRHLRS